MDKVSVVTVTYNCEDTIELTIKSILSQTYDNIEFLVIDGGSTDQTMNIIRSYEERIDFCVSEKDKGIFDAMNKGIKAATGVWIIFINAGDGFAGPDALKTFMSQIDEDVVIAYGDTIMVRSGYYYNLPPSKLEFMSKKMPMQHQSTLIRLDYHKENLFDISYKYAGDYNFLYHSYYHIHCKFQYIPVELSYFDNTGGASKDNHVMAVRECLRFYDREDKFLHQIKIEFWLLAYRGVCWLKQILFGSAKSQDVELMRLRREGIKYQIGKFSPVL